MTHWIKDRVRDTTVTNGTGAITVSGVAPTRYKTFNAFAAVSDTIWIVIAHQTLDEWEISLATYTSANVLTRTTVLSSSTGGSPVNFSAGTKDVLAIQPASAIFPFEFTSSGKGLVPASGGGTTNFLRADGTWAVPAGGGGGTPGGASTNVQFNEGGAFGGDNEFTWLTATKQLLIGAATAISSFPSGFSPHFQVIGTTLNSSSIGLAEFSNDTELSTILFGKSRNASIGSHTVVQSGDRFGGIYFTGSDGSVFRTGAAIEAYSDGTPGSNDMPGRLVFSTTADGAGATTERLRIKQDGTWSVVNNTLGIVWSDAGFDVVFGWDDSAATYKSLLLADLTDEASPTTGDFVLIYGAEGDLRRTNWSNLPGAGGGAPTSASYVVIALDGTLSAERVLAVNSTLTLTDGGANGNATLAINLANANTWTAAQIITLGTAATNEPLRLVNITDNASVQVLELQGDRATMAANDEAYISLILSDSAGNQDEFSRITWRGVDVTSTSNDARLSFSVAIADSLTAKIRLEGSVLSPDASDGTALGSGTLMWADLFLASGGVINFNNGNYTITHSAGLLTTNGNLSLTTSGVLTTGTIELGAATDTTLARSSAGNVSIEGNVIYRAGGTDVTLADGGTGASLTDPNLDKFLMWDDSAATIKFADLASLTTEASPAAGDFIIVMRAEDDLVKVNWSSLPAGGSQTPWTSDIDTADFDLITAGEPLTIKEDDASTNTVRDILNLRRTSSGGVGASGIGAAITFEVECAATTEIGARIAAVATDVTDTSEDFDLRMYTMAAGATAAERVRLSSIGDLMVNTTTSSWRGSPTKFVAVADSGTHWLSRWSAIGNNTFSVVQLYTKTRSTDNAENPAGAVLTGDSLQEHRSYAADGSDFELCGTTRYRVDEGTISLGVVPTNYEVLTEDDVGGIQVHMHIMHTGQTWFLRTTDLTNTVYRPLRLEHATSGTPAANFGVGMEFYLETTSATVALTSISNASPAVFTLAGHGLAAGDQVVLSTTGTLPSGLITGLAYYVRSAGLTANEFTVTAFIRGAAINTSSAGSGTHSITYRHKEVSVALDGLLTDTTLGSEDVDLDVKLITGGTLTSRFKFVADGTINVNGFKHTASDAGFDVLYGWDDSASTYKSLLLADIATEAAPASGDFLVLYGAEGDLRKVNWSSLPGGGGGSPGGSDTHVQFNDGGTFGGDAGLTYNKTSNVLTNTDGQVVLTGGTVTANTPVISATQTWNEAATAFRGIQLTVTPTAFGTETEGVSALFSALADNTADLLAHYYLRNTASGQQARIRFDNDTAPSTTSGAVMFFMGSAVGGVFSNAFGVWNYANGPIHFATNSVPHLSVYSGGSITVDGTLGWSGTGQSDTTTHQIALSRVAAGEMRHEGITALTNTVNPQITLRHTTSGTPAAGIGTGIRFEQETAADNYEVGATIEAVTTDVTDTSEDFDLVFKTMVAGATAAERLRISGGNVGIGSGSVHYQSQIGGGGTGYFGRGNDQWYFFTGANGANTSAAALFYNNAFFRVSEGWSFRWTDSDATAAETMTFGKVASVRTMDITTGTSNTNTVQTALRLSHSTDGTAATGIGVALDFRQDTGSDNFEVGASIQAVTTDVGSGSEDFDLLFRTMAAGAAHAERLRIGSLGVNPSVRIIENEVNLTDAATVSLDASLGNTFKLVAAGNRTIDVPTNKPASGKVQKIVIMHEASAADRTLTLTTGSAGAFRFGTDITALTATTSGLVDYIGCIYNDADDRWDVVSYTKGF